MKEISWIEWLKAETLKRGINTGRLGFSDDAAWLESLDYIVTTDLLCDRVDFDLSTNRPELCGEKALKANLSDLAAMGAKPVAALLNLNIPKECDELLLKRCVSGFLDACQQHGVALVGGDTNVYHGHDLVLAVTVFGAPHWRGVVRRSGARIGDHIFVTGRCGSTFAWQQFAFVPRYELAQALLDHAPIHAMCDLSDGLGKDLRAICRESQVDAVIDREAWRRLARTSIASALSDGEDFELCLCLPPTTILPAHLSASLHRIGKITSGIGELRWADDDSPIQEQGYQHHLLSLKVDTEAHLP